MRSSHVHWSWTVDIEAVAFLLQLHGFGERHCCRGLLFLFLEGMHAQGCWVV
jgi:hypothetical protein